jgi:hypothetical protein
MGSIFRTWALIKESFRVLVGDSKLIVFPILSVLALVLIDGWGLLTFGTQLRGPGRGIPTDVQLLVFLFYWINYFIVLFFNSALMACAYLRISGGDPSLGAGLRTAWENVGRIFLWSFVAATVGFVLRLLEQHSVLRRFVASLLELAWSLGTFFIVPVLILEDWDVFGSLKRSAELFRSQWGNEVAGNFSFGVLYFLLSLPAIVVGTACIKLAPILCALLGIGYFMLLFVIMTAVQGIFVVALYRYATGKSDGGFDSALLKNAFS